MSHCGTAAALALLALLPAIAVAQVQKVAIIDLQSVFDGYQKRLDNEVRLKQVADEEEAKLRKLAEQLREIEKRLQENFYPRGSDAETKARTELVRLRAEAQIGQEVAAQRLRRVQLTETYRLYKEVVEASGVVARQKGYTLVLNHNPRDVEIDQFNNVAQLVDALRVRNVLWADGTNDISRDVLEYLNTQYAISRAASPPNP